jgi:serine/threonine protein kinase
MEGGTLESLYQREQEALGHPFCPPRDQVLSWAQDLSQALCFLHNCEQPVIHRDIKPANLLLCRGILKVGDFGLSRATRQGTRAYRMTGCTGTMRYMAPEVMLMDVDGSSSYDEKVDIYSAACIVWFMCMGEKPFGDLPPETVMQGVTRGLRPDLYSVELKHGREMADVIRDGWAVNPGDRMSAEEMVARVKKAREGSMDKGWVEQQRKSKGSKGILGSSFSHAKKMWSRVVGGSRRTSLSGWADGSRGSGDQCAG